MAYDPLGLDQPGTEEGQQITGYDPLGLGVEEKKPSYLEAAKTGLKEGLAGAMRMYEIPSRPILEATGLAAPGTFASELLKPTEEEEKRVGELGIPGQIVRGVAGLPGAALKYAPLMAAAPASILGTAGVFAAERAAEELAAGKKPSPVELGEEAIIGGVFRGIEPLGRLARSAILSGTFSTQAFGETYAQTKDLGKSLEAAIAPGVIGAGLGLMGRGRRGERPIPRPGEEEIRRIPPIPESRYQMGTPGWPRPEELPYPVVPYGRGGPVTEMVWNPRTQRFEAGDYFRVEPGGPREPGPPGGLTWTPTGAPPPPPDWVREGRVQPPPQYPPVPYVPRPTGRPSEPIIPPTPAPTPAKAPKAPGIATAPATDKQMAMVRENAADIGGLSVDLIKRWTGLGAKRANGILEAMTEAGEIEGTEPGSPYPWRIKGITPPTAPPPTKLPGDAYRFAYEIHELRDLVRTGEPGKKVGTETGETASWSSTYPTFMTNKGWTKVEVLEAIDRGMRGEKFDKISKPSKKFPKGRGAKQEAKLEEIWETVKKEARGIFLDRIGEQKKERLVPIPTADLEVGDRVKVKGEVLEVTQKDANKIVVKDDQEYILDPVFDKITGRRIAPKPGARREVAPTGKISEPSPPAVPMTLDEFRNWEFPVPEGGASKTPRAVMRWREAGEIGETLADLAGYDDKFRLNQALAIGPENDWQGIKPVLGIREKIRKGDPITVYRAVEKGSGQEIIPGSYVTESREYAKRHGEEILKGNYEIKQEDVWADELMSYDDPHEFIYVPRTPEMAFERFQKLGGKQPGKWKYALSEVQKRLAEEEPWGIEGKEDWMGPIIAETAKKYGVPEDLLRKHSLWLPKKMGPETRMPATIEGLEKEGIAPSQLVKPAVPAPSPTRPGEQLLPGMKVGLEMAGAKEGAAPTLEGSPLMEAARRAEMERMQPGLPLGNWRQAFDATIDPHRKADILRAIADISESPKELSDVLDRVTGLPEEANIRWAVAQKMKARPGLFAEGDRTQQLDRAISDGEIRLRSGVNAIGEPLTPGEIEATRRAVENAKGEKQAMPEAPQAKDPLADFQADPLKYIPDDLTVDAKAIREKTGKEITMKQNAKEAYTEITDRLKTFRDFWNCVKS